MQGPGNRVYFLPKAGVQANISGRSQVTILFTAVFFPRAGVQVNITGRSQVNILFIAMFTPTLFKYACG